MYSTWMKEMSTGRLAVGERVERVDNFDQIDIVAVVGIEMAHSSVVMGSLEALQHPYPSLGLLVAG